VAEGARHRLIRVPGNNRLRRRRS